MGYVEFVSYIHIYIYLTKPSHVHPWTVVSTAMQEAPPGELLAPARTAHPVLWQGQRLEHHTRVLWAAAIRGMWETRNLKCTKSGLACGKCFQPSDIEDYKQRVQFALASWSKEK